MTNNQLTENSVTQLLNSVKLARDNAERDDNRVDHSFYYALARALEELKEHRKAAMDSEPVAYMWDSKRNDIDAPGFYFPEHLFFAESNVKQWGGEVIPLYRHAQQPVIPDGYVMVPMRLTAENGAKGALSGEFSETKFVNCPECFGDDECETCDGSGRIEIKVPVSWTTIKDIWIKGIEHFAAAPQENN